MYTTNQLFKVGKTDRKWFNMGVGVMNIIFKSTKMDNFIILKLKLKTQITISFNANAKKKSIMDLIDDHIYF